jgi:carboxyl-terminal processing protease
MRSGVKALLVVAAVVAAILLVLAGFLLGMNPDIGGAVRGHIPGGLYGWSGSDTEYELQQEVLDKLENTYYKVIEPDSLEGDAIDGMLAGLDDPYTVYMDPEEYASFIEDSSGSYQGVGMVVEMKDRLVTIVSTFKGSPAQMAGVQPGDIVLSVDGVSTDGLNLDEVVGRIKGTEGTSVVLEMYRPAPSTTTTLAGGTEDVPGGATTTTTADTSGSTADRSMLPAGGDTSKYTMTRQKIAIPVTDSETLETHGKKVALIDFYTFSQGSSDELRAQVKRAVEEEGVDAIILDLRSNGGGLLNEAIDVASIFIPEGSIVSTEGVHSPEQVFYAEGGAFSQVPLYVLTDEFTASASEIVSGALQDYGRATLVGETTFGKGLVQSLEALSNGGAIKVTTAVYLTPHGRDINKTGIAPDVAAPDDPATTTVDEGVEAALELISGTAAK